MEKDDKGSTLIRIGVSGWKFLLVPAYPGCPGSKAVKRSLLSMKQSKSRHMQQPAIVWLVPQCACHGFSKMTKGRFAYFYQNVSQLSLVKEYFPIIIYSAVWLRQLAKRRHSQIFAKIWGNFPIYAKTRDEANKISK